MQKNYFAPQAKNYALFRPTYPDSLFAFLADIAPDHLRAWDCGTGNGQAAVSLARHFREVIASDVSSEQLTAAVANPRVSYRCVPAEQSGLEDGSVNLITAAAAVHWFELPAFYNEARRVLSPNGVIALWTYFDMQIDSGIDEALQEFSRVFLRGYWSQRMEYVLALYQNLPFPFHRIKSPEFYCEQSWNLERLLSFIETFSGVKAYIEREGDSPVPRLRQNLAPLWGELNTERCIRWPLSLCVGRLDGD